MQSVVSKTGTIDVSVIGGQLSADEINEYVTQLCEKYKDRVIESIEFKIDGEYVNTKCNFKPMPDFQRIRRITGYLVGTLDRFNDGKKAEESQRVKHTVG